MSNLPCRLFFDFSLEVEPLVRKLSGSIGMYLLIRCPVALREATEAAEALAGLLVQWKGLATLQPPVGFDQGGPSLVLTLLDKFAEGLAGGAEAEQQRCCRAVREVVALAGEGRS